VTANPKLRRASSLAFSPWLYFSLSSQLSIRAVRSANSRTACEQRRVAEEISPGTQTGRPKQDPKAFDALVPTDWHRTQDLQASRLKSGPPRGAKPRTSPLTSSRSPFGRTRPVPEATRSCGGPPSHPFVGVHSCPRCGCRVALRNSIKSMN